MQVSFISRGKKDRYDLSTLMYICVNKIEEQFWFKKFRVSFQSFFARADLTGIRIKK